MFRFRDYRSTALSMKKYAIYINPILLGTLDTKQQLPERHTKVYCCSPKANILLIFLVPYNMMSTRKDKYVLWNRQEKYCKTYSKAFR